MIGGEFVSHIETPVAVLNDDPKHPATRDFGKSWVVVDEIYSHGNFSRTRSTCCCRSIKYRIPGNRGLCQSRGQAIRAGEGFFHGAGA